MSRRTEVTLIHDPIVISSGSLSAPSRGIALAVGLIALAAGGYLAFKKLSTQEGT